MQIIYSVEELKTNWESKKESCLHQIFKTSKSWSLVEEFCNRNDFSNQIPDKKDYVAMKATTIFEFVIKRT
jgi:hypothetical protein